MPMSLSDNYPPPQSSGGIFITTAQGCFRLFIPSNEPDGRNHEVMIPMTFDGFMQLARILQSRAQAPAQRIGNDGAPTQAQAIDQYIRLAGQSDCTKLAQANPTMTLDEIADRVPTSLRESELLRKAQDEAEIVRRNAKIARGELSAGEIFSAIMKGNKS